MRADAGGPGERTYFLVACGSPSSSCECLVNVVSVCPDGRRTVELPRLLAIVVRVRGVEGEEQRTESISAASWARARHGSTRRPGAVDRGEPTRAKLGTCPRYSRRISPLVARNSPLLPPRRALSLSPPPIPAQTRHDRPQGNSQCAPSSRAPRALLTSPPGHRQLGSTPRRVRQRPQAKGQQRLGQRRRRDRLRRQARPPHRRPGLRLRPQGPPGRRPPRRHRPHPQGRPPPRRPLHPLRRQRRGSPQQQARDAGHAHRWRRERGPAHEGLGEDRQFGS